VNSLNKSPQGFGFGGGIDMNHKQTKGLEQKPAAGFLSSGSSGSSSIFPPFSTMNNSADHKPTGFGGGNMESVFNSFSTVKPPEPTPAASNSAEDDEDAEPPKYEFVPVVEETALFSKRCKLFEKKEGSFKDRGIGVLYINEVKTDKFQVVIRADNSLGTVMLNMMLNSELPVQKSGKNNVLTVDPTADAGKGVSILIRVKTGEDADELIEKLNEFKAKSS
jgi:nuclear pore complex protein Nup50